MSVDLPAFGNPTSPTSASSFRCSRRSRSSPGSPGWVRRGARLVELDELRVAPAAVAALGDQHAHAGGRQIGELHDLALGTALVDDGADRHLQLDVGAAPAGAFRAFAVRAAVGFENFLKAIVEEGVQVGARRPCRSSRRGRRRRRRARRAARTSHGGNSWRPLRRGRPPRGCLLRRQTSQSTVVSRQSSVGESSVRNRDGR